MPPPKRRCTNDFCRACPTHPHRNGRYSCSTTGSTTSCNTRTCLPEVWLHWDPKSRWQRGTDALPRFRMDFLMLLPNGIRIVIEIDGRHHYSIGDKPSPEEYAKNMSADRELKLNGYEVFRFRAAELPSDTLEERVKSRGVVEEFFRAVFDHYRIDLQPRAAGA